MARKAKRNVQLLVLYGYCKSTSFVLVLIINLSILYNTVFNHQSQPAADCGSLKTIPIIITAHALQFTISLYHGRN